MGRILIIKLGLCETLESAVNRRVCYGDVLRTTFVLEYFKDKEVCWLTRKEAAVLLEGNKYISRVISDSKTNRRKLLQETYDSVVNLEKIPDVCEFASLLKSQNKFGFGYDLSSSKIEPLMGADNAFMISGDPDRKRKNTLTYQEHVAEIIGRKWNGQEYSLAYEPKSSVLSDIGFNWLVGKRWRNKAWPKKHWEDLHNMARKRYSVSWQEGMCSMNDYIDWINSCRIIVTNDSLGLHIAIALKKRLVVLCGPTSASEISLYGLGSFIMPETHCQTHPCFSTECAFGSTCLEEIKPPDVISALESEIRKLDE